MVRPRKHRHMCYNPQVRYFKPQGIPMSHLEEVNLSHDEMEALWLKHHEGLEQTQGAERMQISQSTFGRILQSAHQKMAQALLDGKAIRIDDTDHS